MRFIDKDTYIECVNSIKDYSEKELNIVNSTDGLLDLINFDELQKMISNFIMLLEYCTEDDDYENLDGTKLSKFIFDNNFGKDVNSQYKSIEELWDSINKEAEE